MIGRKLAHYEIVAKLGAGGMGEVYRARDTRLEREVALKILPEDLAGSQERLDRFEREAKAVAAINHPNIVAIYSAEEDEGLRFLTMELVQGRTLDQLVPEQGLPLDRFFKLAVPLADALSAAHAAGIVHRDIKPSNIMVSTEGQVKVLDFGLARLRQPVMHGQETEAPTEAITDEGKVVGTLPYMSPEQVQGLSIDHRSDIFSLGAVFYQMLSGQRPFCGATSAELMSSILRDAPTSATELRPELPAHLSRIIRRCLEKRPDRRTQSALDLRNELEDLQEGLAAGEAWSSSSILSPPPRSRLWLPLAAALTAAVLTAAGIYLGLRSRSQPAQDELGPVTFTRLTTAPGQEQSPSLSPDGEFVAYASPADGDWDIYLLRVGGSNSINLTESSEADEIEPAFSPDGQQIAFSRDSAGIFVMGATGESARRLTNIGADPDWSPDGRRIVFSTQSVPRPWASVSAQRELSIVDVDTGEVHSLGVDEALSPRWSASGDWIAYWGIQASKRQIFIIRAGGEEPRLLVDDDHNSWGPAWAPDGRYLFFSSDRSGSANIWRIPVDPRSGEATTAPLAVTTGVGPTIGIATVARQRTRLAYPTDEEVQGFLWVALDEEGETVVSEPQPIAEGSERYIMPKPSPDGTQVALIVGTPGDLAVVHRDGSGFRRLTNDAHRELYPSWSPDGKTIAFASNRSGQLEIWAVGAEGGELRKLSNHPGLNLNAPVWSPDGTKIAAVSHATRSSYLIDLTEPLTDQRLLELRPDDPDEPAFVASSWSADGTRLAGSILTDKGLGPGSRVFDLERRVYVASSDAYGGFKFMRDDERVIASKGGELYVLDLETGDARLLLSATPDYVFNTYLSADDSILVYNTRRLKSDLWLLDAGEPAR